MRVVRSTGPRAYFADNVSDAHIEAAIADPDRVVLQQVGNVFRVVGLTYPLRDGRMYVFSPTSLHENPALLEVVYEDQGLLAFVMFAAEADEEELDQWIRS